MSATIPVALGRVDPAQRALLLAEGGRRSLSAQELALLRYLADRPGQDVSRDELLIEVMGYASAAQSRAVDDAIKRLRAKLESAPSRPSHIVGVRGVGYRFVPLHSAPVEFGDRARLELPDRAVDLDRLEVREASGATQGLSAHEGRFLEVLARRPGHVVDHDTLLWEVWGLRSKSQRRLVGKLLYRLRAKLEPDPGAPVTLVSVRGAGVRLELRTPLVQRTSATGEPAQAPLLKLLGRAAEREAVRRAFEDGARVVSLIGPGGAGKTTLALDIAARQWTHARVVRLLQARDEAGVLRAAAEGLGAPDSERRSVTRALPGWARALVLLDNAETCDAALGPLLLEWLREAPEARFLVTSRRPLKLGVERVVRLGPLPPQAAAQLLRARAASVGLRLSEADEEAVGQIVAAVDGLPLALELAASRLPLLGLGGLLERLERPLSLLRTTRQDLPPRHRSLRAAVELSWELLTPAERRVLSGCCVFHGDLGLEEAAAVVSEDPDALDHVQSLLDASLLRAVDGHGGRKRLAPYAVVRELALDAAEPAALEAVRHRHLSWLADLGRRLGPGEEPQPEAYPTLRLRLEDGAQALRFGVQVGRREDAVACARWVLPMLLRRGAHRRMEALLAALAPAEEPELLRLEALLREQLGALERGAALVEEVVRRAEVLGEAAVGASALLSWSVLTLGRNPKEATALLDRAEALADGALSPAHAAALQLLRARLAYYEGQQDAAWTQALSALGRLQSLGQGWWACVAMTSLAELAYLDERYTEARSWVGMALEVFRATESTPMIDYGLSFIAVLEQAEGRLDEALTLHEALLERSRRSGDARRECFEVYAIGGLLGMAGRQHEAAEAFGVALALSRQQRNRVFEGWVLIRVAGTDWRLGRPNQARAALHGAIEAFAEVGRPVMAEAARTELGRVELMEGRLEVARALLSEAARRLASVSGGEKHRWLAVALLAEVRLRLGEPEQASTALEAAEALRVSWPQEGYARALVSLGMGALALGAKEEAEACLEDAARIQLAAKDHDGDIARAVARLRAALAEAPA